jgi:hypothetical protein
MDVTIEKVRGTVIAKLPAEAVEPDARLRANLVGLMDAKDVKALLVDMIEISEMTDALASFVLAIQHQAGLRDLSVVYFDVGQQVKDYLDSSGMSAILEIAGSRVAALRPFL